MLEFEKITSILKQAQSGISQAKGKNITMFLGATGSGKSTTINYLMHYKMEYNECGELVPADPSIPMPCYARGGSSSATEVPGIVQVNNTEALCDCPGFYDTRGDEMRVAVSLATEALVRSAGTIRGLVVIIDWHSISAGRSLAFIQAAQAIASLIRSDADIDWINSIRFVFTKQSARSDNFAWLGKYLNNLEIDTKNKIEKLHHSTNPISKGVMTAQSKLREIAIGASDRMLPGKGDGMTQLPKIPAEETYQNPTDVATEQDNRAIEDINNATDLLSIINLLKLHLKTNSVTNCDLLDNGASREKIYDQIRSMKSVPIDAFNFTCADSARERFSRQITEKFIMLREKILRINFLDDQINKQKQALSSSLLEEAEFRKQLANIKSGEHSLGENNPVVQHNKSTLEVNKGKLECKESELAELSQKIQQYREKLLKIDTSEEIFFRKMSHQKSRVGEIGFNTTVSLLAGAVAAGGAVVSDDMNHMTKAATVVASPIIQGLGMALAIPVAIGSSLYRFTHEFKYDGAPFTRVEEKGNRFDRQKFEPSIGVYVAKYSSARGGYADAAVTIFGEKRNEPKNKIEIDRLNGLLKDSDKQEQDLRCELEQYRCANEELGKLIVSLMSQDDDQLSSQLKYYDDLLRTIEQRKSFLEEQIKSHRIESDAIQAQLEDDRDFVSTVTEVFPFAVMSNYYPGVLESVVAFYGCASKSSSVGSTTFFQQPNLPSQGTDLEKKGQNCLL